MWRITILITVVALGLLEACTYKGDECPDYTVVENHTDYEVRSYGSLTRVHTSVVSPYGQVGKDIAFGKLYEYINGQNDRNQTMDMTVPILTLPTKAGSKTIFEMFFMIPSQFAADPPVPTDKDIKIKKVNPNMYAVRTFKGFVWGEGQWLKQAKQLAESVKDDKAVDSSWFVEVEYDAPYVFTGRRNEVWMYKKNETQTNDA